MDINESNIIVLAGDTYRNRHWAGVPGGHNKGKFKKLAKKCTKCGSTENLDIHHKSGNRSDLKSGKGLQVLCRSCHRKLHQGNGQSDASSIILTCEGRIIPDAEVRIDDDKLAIALGDKKQRDLLFVAFKLVHANTNSNRDTFTEEELLQAKLTPIHKPLDWEHGEPNIGVIYDSVFRKATKDEPAYLEVAAAVWKYKYPEYAKEMMDRYSTGELMFSMETWFKRVKCSDCNETFENQADANGTLCDHLTSLYLAKAKGILPEGLNTHRYLLDVCFGGAGVTVRPANEGSITLAVASKTNSEEVKENMSDEKKYSEAEYKEAIKTAVAQAIEDYKAESESEQAVAALKNELASAKADSETKALQVAELQKKIEEVSNAFEGFKKEVALEKTVASRIESLKKDEFTIPEAADELKEFMDFIGSLDDAKFQTFAKSQKRNNKLAGMSDEEKAKYLEDLKKKKAAKASDSKDDAPDGAADASIRMPVGVGASKKEDNRPDHIKNLDKILESVR